MSNNKPVPEGKDPELWKLARKRASFKTHIITYLIVNAFLWALWYFGDNDHAEHDWSDFPWPIWTTLSWGAGLAFHYAAAYGFSKTNTVEKEYEKLINKK